MNSKIFKEITETLSKKENIDRFVNKYGLDFVKRICCSAGEDYPTRLHFEMGITHGFVKKEADYCLKVISYNNDIVGLFYTHPDFCKGFSDYTPAYPVTCSCWKGTMYVYCNDNMLSDLTGYGTREIIGRILGYDLSEVYRAERGIGNSNQSNKSSSKISVDEFLKLIDPIKP